MATGIDDGCEENNHPIRPRDRAHCLLVTIVERCEHEVDGGTQTQSCSDSVLALTT